MGGAEAYLTGSLGEKMINEKSILAKYLEYNIKYETKNGILKIAKSDPQLNPTNHCLQASKGLTAFLLHDRCSSFGLGLSLTLDSDRRPWRKSQIIFLFYPEQCVLCL